MTEKSVFCHCLVSAPRCDGGSGTALLLACHFLWAFRTAWKIFIIRPKCRQGGGLWQGARGWGLCHHLLSDVLVVGHLRTSVPMLQSSWWQHSVSDWKCHGIVSGAGSEGRQIQCDDRCCHHHTLGERRKTRGCYGLVQLMMPTYWVIIADTFPVPIADGNDPPLRLKFYNHGEGPN